MLTRLLLQAAQNGELQGIQAIGGRGLGGEGGTVVVDENCSVRLPDLIAWALLTYSRSCELIADADFQGLEKYFRSRCYWLELPAKLWWKNRSRIDV